MTGGLTCRPSWSPRWRTSRERDGLVFVFKSRGNCQTQWAGAIRRAGIKLTVATIACRHGFATGLLDKGVSPITVAKRGGWKDARHVFETYGHDVASEDVTDVLTGTPATQTGRKYNVGKSGHAENRNICGAFLFRPAQVRASLSRTAQERTGSADTPLTQRDGFSFPARSAPAGAKSRPVAASDRGWPSELARSLHDLPRRHAAMMARFNIVFADSAPDSCIGIGRLHLADVDRALS